MKPCVLIVMGVSATGKSTIARGLATALGWRFQEGDTLHPRRNVRRMARGIPLTDADRTPWLRRIRAVVRGWLRAGTSGVITCSALRRRYRRIVIADPARIRLIYLHGAPGLLRARMRRRHGHFMPPRLLASQLATLEPPSRAEHAIAADVTPPPAAIIAGLLLRLCNIRQGAPLPGGAAPN